METRSYNVYKFDELSDEAKESAINSFRGIDQDLPWIDENRKSMETFCDIFNVKVTDWHYSPYSHSSISFNMDNVDDDVKELKGIRLLKYIVNNYWSDLFKGKFFSTSGKYIDGQYHYRSRHSKVMFETSCVLTGYCLDDDILKPVYDFLKKPDENVDLEYLVNDCLWSWIYACNRDIEYQFSDEAITETIECNDYMFTEDGELA